MTCEKHNIPFEADGDASEDGLSTVWTPYCPICYEVEVIKSCIETKDIEYTDKVKFSIIKAAIENLDEWRLKE